MKTCVTCASEAPRKGHEVCDTCCAYYKEAKCESCSEYVLQDIITNGQCEQCFNYCECGARLCEEEGSSPGDGMCRRCD